MDIELLEEIMRERGVSARQLAKKTGICRFKLSLKFAGWSDFKLHEIEKISEALCLNYRNIDKIFFETKVS